MHSALSLSEAEAGSAERVSVAPVKAAEASAAQRTQRPQRGPWYYAALSAASVLVVLVLWQLSGTLKWIDPLLLPPPSEIWVSTRELLETGYRQIPLWQHFGVSVLRASVAFAVAIIVGIPIGLGMGLSPGFNAVLNPFVQFLRPLPKIALIPLTVVVGAAAAVGSVSQGRIRAARVLGANRRQIYTHVVLPNAAPELFTSVRLAVGIGWTSLIAAEMVAATSGLGWMVMNAGTYLRTDVVMLGIVLLGLTGYLFDLALVLAQRATVPWAGRDT